MTFGLASFGKFLGEEAARPQGRIFLMGLGAAFMALGVPFMHASQDDLKASKWAKKNLSEHIKDDLPSKSH